MLKHQWSLGGDLIFSICYRSQNKVLCIRVFVTLFFNVIEKDIKRQVRLYISV